MILALYYLLVVELEFDSFCEITNLVSKHWSSNNPINPQMAAEISMGYWDELAKAYLQARGLL
jgi:hypothetical protein